MFSSLLQTQGAVLTTWREARSAARMGVGGGWREVPLPDRGIPVVPWGTGDLKVPGSLSLSGLGPGS